MHAANTAPPGTKRSRRRRGGRWHAFTGAVQGVSNIDPATVQAELQRLGSRRRWLTPLVFVAGTVGVVFRGVLLLLRNWRLSLLMVVPAVWIWLMAWNVRTHLFSNRDLPTEYAEAIAVVVIVGAVICYWCNAVFAFAITQHDQADLRLAFRQARPRWRLVTGVALVTGAAQAAVWLWVAPLGPTWFAVGLTGMLLVQAYMFLAVPAWLLGTRPKEAPREKLSRTVTTGALSGVAVAPGFLLNRLGLLLLGISEVWILGVVLVSVGAVLHVAASSSVRVVKMSVRLRTGDDDEPAPEPAPASTGAA